MAKLTLKPTEKKEPEVRLAVLPLSKIMYQEVGSFQTRVHIVRRAGDIILTSTVAETEERAIAIAGELGEVLATEDMFKFFAQMESIQSSRIMRLPVSVSTDYVRPN